jgi:hypothetical protein
VREDAIGDCCFGSQIEGARLRSSVSSATSRIRMTRAPGVRRLVEFWRAENFRGVLHMCALRAPCQWVDSTKRDEVEFTAPGRLDRRAEWMAHLTQELST